LPDISHWAGSFWKGVRQFWFDGHRHLEMSTSLHHAA
jgi:hypothetical protein